jgi:adhesin transport system membrane fusion protein
MTDKPQTRTAGAVQHLLLGLCVVLTIAFFVWAAVAQLDIVSMAPGRVIPAGRIKEIQHLEGGIIEDILVAEGTSVEKGQVLLVLRGVGSDATLGELETHLAALRIERLRLDAMIQMQDDFQIDVESARLNPELSTQSKLLFTAKMNEYEAGQAALKESIIQRRREIEQIAQKIEGNRKNVALLRKQINISEQLLADNLNTEYEHLTFLREEVALTTALKEDERIMARAESALREAEENLRHHNSEFIAGLQQERGTVQRQLKELGHRLKKFRDDLERTAIKAPVDGIVKTLYVDTRGGVIGPGVTIMDIVPVDDALIIEAQLSIEDISSVRPGQPAVIKLANRNARRVGKIEGEVVHISPDALTSDDDITYYVTRIRPTEDFFIWNDKRYQLIPGMGVAVFIQTGRRTIMNYLLDPFIDSLSQSLQES